MALRFLLQRLTDWHQRVSNWKVTTHNLYAHQAEVNYCLEEIRWGLFKRNVVKLFSEQSSMICIHYLISNLSSKSHKVFFFIFDLATPKYVCKRLELWFTSHRLSFDTSSDLYRDAASCDFCLST